LLKLVPINNKYPAHVFVVCDACGIEADILNILEIDGLYDNGWTEKKEYIIDAPNGEKYKDFDWCPKCSLERANKL